LGEWERTDVRHVLIPRKFPDECPVPGFSSSSRSGMFLGAFPGDSMPEPSLKLVFPPLPRGRKEPRRLEARRRLIRFSSLPPELSFPSPQSLPCPGRRLGRWPGAGRKDRNGRDASPPEPESDKRPRCPPSGMGGHHKSPSGKVPGVFLRPVPPPRGESALNRRGGIGYPVPRLHGIPDPQHKVTHSWPIPP